MASPDVDLVHLQQWMQRVIVDTDDDIAHALAASEAREIVSEADLADVILPSRTLTPAERLEIYRGMYPLRMVEALESDYPGLAHFLGERRFSDLVCRYIAVHPSRSHTLNRLGDHLPEFVATAPDVPRPAVAADLARLERAVAQAFDAEESPLLDAAAIAAAGARAAEARIVPIPALRLLAFRYPVNEYLQSVRDDVHDHPPLRARNTWVAVFRRQYVVRRLDLTKEQHALLAALVGGATLGDAVMAALKSTRRRVGPDEFFVWFRQWVAAGMFHSLQALA